MSKILEVGTKIRSYDFFGVVDYYIEGVINAVCVDVNQYEVSPTKIVRGGDATITTDADSYLFFVDFIGQRMVDDQWTRIEVIV